MKKLIFILSLLPLVVFAQKKYAAPPPPPPPPPSADIAPPAPVPPVPPVPPMFVKGDSSKPMKLRTKRIEVIVDDKGNRTERTTETDGDEDVNIRAGKKRVIIRKRKQGDGEPDNEMQVGDRRIIIKKDGKIDSSGTDDIKIIRRKKDKDGDVTIIDTDAAGKELEQMMEELGKEMEELGKEMDGLGKEMDGKGKKMEELSKEMEKNTGNADAQAKIKAEMDKLQQEMEELGKKMQPKGDEMGRLGKKMKKLNKKHIKIYKNDDNDGETDATEPQEESHAEAKSAGTSDHNRRAKVKNRFIMFDFGVNGFAQKGSLNLIDDAAPLELSYGKSFMYRIGAFRQRVPLDRKGIVNLMWGANFEMDNYEFSKPITLAKNTDPLLITSDNTINYSKNRLYTSWAELPLMLHFETNPRNSTKSFRIGVGAQGGLMLGSLTDQCDKTTDKKTVVESGFNLNKVRYGAQAQIGYGPVNFVAQYNISPLFQAGKGPDVNTFNIGFSVVPF